MRNASVSFKKITAIFLSWRLFLVAVGLISAKVLVLKPDFLGREFGRFSVLSGLWPWANFDGAHYLSIATKGYGQFEYAFFPGYPLLINLLSRLWPDPLGVAFLLSNLLTVVFLFLLYKFWRLDFPEQTVSKGIILLLFFPSAFFWGAVYGESLFLTLAAGCLLAGRRDKYWLAFPLGALACLTRLVGVFLIPALLLIWLKSKRRRSDLILIILTALGFFAVLAFNGVSTGDPLYFFHVQPSFGAERSGGSLVFLPQVFFRYLKIFLTVNPFSLAFYTAAQELTLVILSLVVLVLGWKKIKIPELFFSAGVLLLPTFTGTLSSMPRYILAAFPLFIVGAQILKEKWWFRTVVIIFLLWQVINVSLFLNGYWVS